MWHAGVYGGRVKSKRCVFRCFLEVATEMAESTDSGWLFQRDKVQKLGTDTIIVTHFEGRGIGKLFQKNQ